MRKPVFTKQFQRDLKRMERRGKELQKLKDVLGRLVRGEPLEPRLRDHKLKGEWIGRRECHVKPDWLLIYKLAEAEIVFERTGTHSDLFE